MNVNQRVKVFFDGVDSSSIERMTTGLWVALGLFSLLTVANFILLASLSNSAAANITLISELQLLSQHIAKTASEASKGNEESFEALEDLRDGFTVKWEKLQEESSVDVELAQNSWNTVRAAADLIIESEDTIMDIYDLAATLKTAVPELQTQYNEVVEILLSSNAPADQIVTAQRQTLIAEKIKRNISEVLSGSENDDAATAFESDAATFKQVLNGMLNGDKTIGMSKVTNKKAVEYLSVISESFEENVTTSIDGLVEESSSLVEVNRYAQDIFPDVQDLLEVLTVLSDEINESAVGVVPSLPLGLILMVLAVFIFGILNLLQGNEERQSRETLEEENERNQNAILRLLDELGDFADGDLTVQATVTEDFTGAIADSINYSIDQTRVLVESIKRTAVAVASSAQETQSTASHLAEASEHQAQEIAGASAAVNEMAVSIDQVSANAAESTAVAERSVAIANKGAEVVQNTIHGMDTIREQIQETSKRIKRLGESSQEIGDIVSLINDIADQTNILALNAAIQASMAGDAGRGFAVVADEVQRLAERSSAATKQIETLVKTIQSDTNEAVISMEQTTLEVVNGAGLAQDAGVALEEIEKVSKNLADLIQNISNAARQQAASAGHISNTMNVIQEITSQTSAGTGATAESIGNLADMAGEMRNSVAGFTLPETVS